jgi:hypothetical protein
MILDVLFSFPDPSTCAGDNLFMFQGVLQKESMTILQATAMGERVERPIPVARASEVYCTMRFMPLRCSPLASGPPPLPTPDIQRRSSSCVSSLAADVSLIFNLRCFPKTVAGISAAVALRSYDQRRSPYKRERGV